MPATVVWMLAAFAITAGVRAVLSRIGFYRIVWHRSLFNFSLYILVLGAIVALVWRAPS
ncbi:efflux system membrane protein [compost metagenome]